MSKYTTEVRYICETYAGLDVSQDNDKVEDVITDSMDKVFDFEFPIFDESYRSVLERKILRHYYTREIAFETVGLWKLKLNTKLNEIMPYYNKLYESELMDFNPFYDVNLTREYNKKNEGESAGQSTDSNSSEYTSETTRQNNGSDNATSTGWNMFNDTPQGALTDIDNGDYLTNATKVTNTSSSTNSNRITGEDSGSNTSNGSNNYENNMNSTEDYIEKVKGLNGGMSMSKRLKEFRETFLNIDMMVIDNLKDLFFYLW